MNERFDVCALARAIRLRREAYERETGYRVPITPAMSRILECDAEYVPYRTRKTGRCIRAAQNPSIGSVVAIADALHTTVGALLRERQYRIGIAERREIRRVLEVLATLLDLDAPEIRRERPWIGSTDTRT